MPDADATAGARRPSSSPASRELASVRSAGSPRSTRRTVTSWPRPPRRARPGGGGGGRRRSRLRAAAVTAAHTGRRSARHAALLTSVLLRPDLEPERLHLVTLAAGIAAAQAVLAGRGVSKGRAQVAQRPRGRRSQARRDPGRGRRRGCDRGGHGLQPPRRTRVPRRAAPTSRPRATSIPLGRQS